MKRLYIAPIVLSLAIASATGLATAQIPASTTTAGATDMKMTHAEFLRMYTWDPANEMWVMNARVTPPVGIKSRSTVKAERDLFLRNNRYDIPTSQWVPLGAKPREISTMSREEVRSETIAYMRTHEWDETTEMWVAKQPATRK